VRASLVFLLSFFYSSRTLRGPFITGSVGQALRRRAAPPTSATRGALSIFGRINFIFALTILNSPFPKAAHALQRHSLAGNLIYALQENKILDETSTPVF